MSRAREFADLAGSADAGGLTGRNLIINGAMQVWQRGTSVTASSSGYATADRWRHNASGGTLSLSRQSLTVGQTDIPSQFKYFYRANATTADNNASIAQKIEDVTTVQGTVTVSFYAKGTNPAGGKFNLELRQDFGTGGSSSVYYDNDLVITSSWKRYTFTVDVTSISGKTISSTNSCFWVLFGQPNADTSTTAWTLDITGVQLELGDTATPFEHRSFGEELARCQRYFIKSGNVGTSTEWFPGVATYAGYGASYAQSVDGNQDRGVVHVCFPVYMRARPSMVYYPGRLAVANTANNITAYNGDTLITTTIKPAPNCNGLSNWFGGTSTDNVAYSFMFTADAEL